MNKVLLQGHLGADPILRNTNGDKPVAVCNFSIATTEQWADNNGKTKKLTTWHKCVAWGNQAKACAEYLSKGSPVFVEGRIRTSTYKDDSGGDRRSFEIHATNVKFLASRSKDNDSQSPENEVDSILS